MAAYIGDVEGESRFFLPLTSLSVHPPALYLSFPPASYLPLRSIRSWFSRRWIEADAADHILLLQTSLMHYEYILSHCQPAYLSHLQVSFHITRGGIAKHILALSVVTISILPMQFVTSKFHLPTSSAISPEIAARCNAYTEY